MAGAGYKLFSTGDVLTATDVNTYLMQQTVMVFDDAAARTTALSGVVAEGMLSYLKDTNAVEVYDGSNWVASDDPNAIQNTIVAAKGDIIGASANDVPAVTSVGADGTTLVADSSTTTGLSWQGNYAAGKNKIINGDFNINQRNFTTISGSGDYGFDRWQLGLSGATGTMTAETFTPGTAPVAGYEAKNFARVTITTGNDFARINQSIEDVRTFAGQTVTISFWAKGTNPTTAGNLKVDLEQNFGSGGSPSASVVVTEQTFVLTANWTRYSLTFNVPSISGKTIGTAANSSYLGVRIGQGTSTSTDAWTLDIWGVQVEAGSTATAFQTATGTIQGELAACQRYYFRTSTTGIRGTVGVGGAFNTTVATIFCNLPVVMRIVPNVLDYSTMHLANWTGGTFTISSMTIDADLSTTSAFMLSPVTSGIVGGTTYYIRGNSSASAYIGVSAEL